MSTLGRTCVIANPVAQSGACAAIAKTISTSLCDELGEDNCALIFTDYAGHGAKIAEETGGKYRTVIVIGGDGAVHEVVNGLMKVSASERPRLAVVPVGSGNDYALTLGMSSDPAKALKQILWCDTEMMDIGCVNGEFFAETLSFGLDAAIAEATIDARKKTGRKGTRLYLECGLDQLFNNLKFYQFESTMCLPDRKSYSAKANHNGVCNEDEERRLSELSLRMEQEYPDEVCRIVCGESALFAVQIGKTYGGHFKICPDADPTDGLFDICIAYPPLNSLNAMRIFLSARFGKHTKSKIFEFAQARHLVVDFEEEPPCQVDGEIIHGKTFDITMIPRSLEAIVGSKKGWG